LDDEERVEVEVDEAGGKEVAGPVA